MGPIHSMLHLMNTVLLFGARRVVHGDEMQRVMRLSFCFT